MRGSNGQHNTGDIAAVHIVAKGPERACWSVMIACGNRHGAIDSMSRSLSLGAKGILSTCPKC
jgi:hypothetical protein